MAYRACDEKRLLHKSFGSRATLAEHGKALKTARMREISTERIER
jgi:hypothetical protein